jgi:hypothetical protein
MKRTWTVHVPGYPYFQMVALDGELDYEEALKEAQAIWPSATVS